MLEEILLMVNIRSLAYIVWDAKKMKAGFVNCHEVEAEIVSDKVPAGIISNF
jgi:hypothetical protein